MASGDKIYDTIREGVADHRNTKLYVGGCVRDGIKIRKKSNRLIQGRREEVG